MRNNSVVLVNKKWREKDILFQESGKKNDKFSKKSVLIILATALEFFPLRRPHVKTRCHSTRCHWTSPFNMDFFRKESADLDF